MRNLNVFYDETLLKKVLKYNIENYRSYDPGAFLYRLVINYKGNKYSNEFIELVYTTLISWNMNSRAAKLNKFESFKKSIIDNMLIMKKLTKKNILDIEDEYVKEIISELFNKLKLVEKSKKTSLVTFTKAMHFYFPELIVPIDRAYTCKYFGGSIPSDINGQLKKLFKIENEFSSFRRNMKLKKYLDKKWNLCINKVMDSMVIGYILINKKKK